MPRHVLKRVMPFTPGELFQLVGDVERYPEFVPWVTGMRTWNQRVDIDGASVVDAEASVGFAFLREKFATRVIRDPGDHSVEVDLLRGPFRHLKNCWRFAPHPSGTEIEFMIDYEFKSRFLQAMLEANFDRAVDRLIGCFQRRAETLYGPAAKSRPA